MIWDVEVIVGSNGQIERVTLLHKPPAPLDSRRRRTTVSLDGDTKITDQAVERAVVEGVEAFLRAYAP